MTTSVDTITVAGRDAALDVIVLDALLADITAIKAALAGINAKLDADSGVTATNYAATCDPVALTTVT